MRWFLWATSLDPQTLQKNQKYKKKQKDKKNTNKKYQKKNFSVISQFFFFGGCPNFPFFDNLAKKARTQKHYKNRGFSNPFLENSSASRNGHFWTKKAKIQKFQLSLFLPFSSLSTTKHKISSETPIFIVF